MGENASASFEGATIDEVGAVTVNGSGGDAKVGYLTEVSWRKISMSRGEDFMLIPGRDISVSVNRARMWTVRRTPFWDWWQSGNFTCKFLDSIKVFHPATTRKECFP